MSRFLCSTRPTGVIGDPSRRRVYDQQLQGGTANPEASAQTRAQRTADMQDVYRQQRQSTQSSEVQIDAWLKLVYTPVESADCQNHVAPEKKKFAAWQQTPSMMS